MMGHNLVPKWLRVGYREVNAVVDILTKKPSKKILAEIFSWQSSEIYAGASSLGKYERRRGHPRGQAANEKHSVYMELDEVDGEDCDASSEEKNTDTYNEEEEEEEEEETGEFEEEESDGAVDWQPTNRDELEEQGLAYDGSSGHNISGTMEENRNAYTFQEVGSSGSSSGSQRLPQPATASVSSQKFGSLSATDARPGRPSECMVRS